MSAAQFQAPDTMTDDFGHDCTEVRVLPLGGGGNILCGHRGYCREIAHRTERNRALAPDCRYDLPAWVSLAVYFPEGGKAIARTLEPVPPRRRIATVVNPNFNRDER